MTEPIINPSDCQIDGSDHSYSFTGDSYEILSRIATLIKYDSSKDSNYTSVKIRTTSVPDPVSLPLSLMNLTCVFTAVSFSEDTLIGDSAIG